MSLAESRRSAERPISTTLAATLVALTLILEGAATHAQSPVQVKVDLGLADVLEELRVWWEAAVQRGDAAEDLATRTSAQRLAVAFVRMAGLMDNFADQLDRVSPISSGSRDPQAEELGRKLHRLLHAMKDTLSDIRNALDTIDVDWAVTNLGVIDSASDLAVTRGLVLDEISSLVVTMRTGQAVAISRYDFGSLGQTLRELAARGRGVANEIRTTLAATKESAPSSGSNP